MAIKNYLVESVSGTGKSSVCLELQKRGYYAIDGDKELAYSGNPETGEATNIRGHHTHIWDEEKVRSIVADKNTPVAFFCGGSRNFKKFINLFDLVFVLDADNETIARHLAERPDNTFGKRPEEIELILKLNETKEDIPTNGIIIDATKSLKTVVDSIIQYI